MRFRSGRISTACFSISSSDSAGRSFSASTSAGSNSLSGGEAHRDAQLRPRQGQIVLRANEFLLPRRQAHLRAQVIGFHGHAAFEAILAAIENGLRRLHRLFGDVQLLFREQDAVIGIDHAKDDFLVGAFELRVRRRPWRARRDSRPRQLAKESNRFQVPPKRVVKLPKGVGRIQGIQREIGGRERLLPQFAAKDIHGIVAARGCFRKGGVRQQDGAGFLHVRRGRFACPPAPLCAADFSPARCSPLAASVNGARA